MSKYTLTFKPQNGGTAYIGEGFTSFTITCADGLALACWDALYVKKDDVVVAEGWYDIAVYDEDGRLIAYTFILYEPDGDNTITLTDEGEYTIDVPDEYFVFDDESLSEGFTYSFTLLAGTPVTLPLTDLDGQVTGSAYISPTDGVGDGAVDVTADECEGLDREGTAVFKADGCTDVERRVFQLGLREEFTDRDFLVADGGTFHVLK